MGYGIAAFAQEQMKAHIQPGDLCIDATAGNGRDTLFLCQQVGKNGKVIAFDIQQMAVEHTKKRLADHQVEASVDVLLASHCDMEQYAEKGTVACITFNLGYLPGGDHTLATKADTTIEALESALCLLKKDGLLSIVIYSGGDTGYEEKERVLEWLKQLDDKKYLVLVNQYWNRPNDPPIPVQVIKLC